jgi:small-conductance mechanosensitive channel
VIIRSAMPAVAVALLVWGLQWAGLLSLRAVQLGWALVRPVGLASAAYALGRTLLAPRHAELRLSAVSDRTAAALSAYPLVLGVSAAVGSVVVRAIRIAGVSLSAAVAAKALVATADLVIIALAASAFGRARAAHFAAQDEAGRPERGRGLWTLALFLVWMAVITGAAALLLGYISFAVFLTQETAWIGIVSAVAFVLTNLTDAFAAELASDQGVVGRVAASAMGVGSHTLEQLSVLLGGIARVLLWLLALAVIMAPFGAGTDEIFSRLQSGVTSFKLGGVTVAPAAIAASIGIFVIGLFLTRMFRRWLETQYLPRTRLDRGLSATFGTGVSYIGGVVALLVASAYLGLRLTQVTLFASALTVGIGFGLQAAIQNFVAGLFLLAGRTIRVGDWIAVGGQEGDVQRINVRATEIKLFDGSTLILPNSELVTKPVRNVTWGAPLGQVQISFTVGYDADLDVVAATLVDVFKQTRGVLKDPAPSVVLTEFRDTGAAFSGYAYVATPRAVSRTKSDILLELGRRLREVGIRPGVVVQQAVVAPAARARVAQ